MPLLRGAPSSLPDGKDPEGLSVARGPQAEKEGRGGTLPSDHLQGGARPGGGGSAGCPQVPGVGRTTAQRHFPKLLGGEPAPARSRWQLPFPLQTGLGLDGGRRC